MSAIATSDAQTKEPPLKQLVISIATVLNNLLVRLKTLAGDIPSGIGVMILTRKGRDSFD